MINHIIFDMDGVLIDSEPLWRQAEIDIFSTVGHNLTNKTCLETMGLRMDAAVEYWYSKKSWLNKSKEQVSHEIKEQVITLISEAGTALPGVYKLLKNLKEQDIYVSLCSSSAKNVINVVLNKLKISDYFDCILSTEEVQHGKPHPEAYLTVATRMNTSPFNCLVIEDSFNGMISAKAARMKLIGVPEHASYSSSKFDFCDLKVKSLNEITFEKIKELFE